MEPGHISLVIMLTWVTKKGLYDPRLKLMVLYIKVTASKFTYPKGLNDEIKKFSLA